MNPLPLPTDNLYKFCALTGVLLAAFCAYIAWTKSDDLVRRANDLQLAQEKVVIETEYLSAKIKRVEDAIENFKSQLTEEQSRKSGKVPIPITSAEFRAHVDQLRDLLRDVQIKDAEKAALKREVNQASGRLHLILWFGWLGSIVGVVMGIYGFSNWYAVQRLQDRLLESSVNK